MREGVGVDQVVQVVVKGEVVTVDGVVVKHDGSVSLHEVAVAAVARGFAGPSGRPVTVSAADADGEVLLSVYPDGHSVPLPAVPALPGVPAVDEPVSVDLEAWADLPAPPAGFIAGEGGPVPALEPVVAGAPVPAAPALVVPVVPVVQVVGERLESRAAVQVAVKDLEREVGRSFLARHEDASPATMGWRGWLTRSGLRTGPSAAELREQVRAVSRHWPGPRTIAVVNGKGGAGKTPTTVLLSALFARRGGSGVLAWDNNETRGTLGWRTEQGPHDGHVLALLPDAGRLMLPDARAADLAAYVHHQSADKYDVLRSNPAMLPHQQRLTAQDFDAVHQVAAKYYRLIVIDSGNDETAPHWLRMIDHADQLVVATTTRPDHAEAGRLLLEALHQRDERSAALADAAVVIVSQADREEASAHEIAAGFAGISRAAVTVPYDPAIRAPWLRLDALRPVTQDAYRGAAMVVSEGL